MRVITIFGLLVGLWACILGVICGALWLLRRKGVIPYCYRVTDFSEEAISLSVGKKEHLIKWTDVEAVYPYSFSRAHVQKLSIFELELVDGDTCMLGVFPKNVSSLLVRFYDAFLKSLSMRMEDIRQIEFSHPTHWIRNKKRAFSKQFMGTGFFALVWLGLWIPLIIYARERVVHIWVAYLLALYPIIICIGILVYEWLQAHRHKCLLSLRVLDGQLRWQDDFGRPEVRALSEVKSFKLDKLQGFLGFSDGTTLRDLEKLRYWPILREYLLSKLEPIEKQKNK